MSDEDINMRLKWRFSRDEKAFFVYSNSFDTSLIADVKIEIFSGVLNLKEYFVVLSKTPYTPANATITIQSRGFDEVEHVIYQKHVNRWVDNYSFKCKFHKDSLLTDELDSVILSELQCDITWHGYDESERDIIYGSLEQFITAPDFSDMVIVIGEKEIPVHKIILAAYSPVFLAMFKANMTASVNKRIIVTDIEVDIMKKVIDFMYTGVIHPESIPDGIYANLKNFLTSPDLSDMTIVIDEREIPVHKIILAAYSPVFLAMFKANMIESVNKQIIVRDIQVSMMKKVIDFMYMGIIHPVPEICDLLSILQVADKYEIMALVTWCERKLVEKMKVENVLEILDKASEYGVLQLIKTAISFMVKNKSAIIKLEELKDLHRRKPEVLLEFVVRSIAAD
ncbi:hypothetical protein PV326_002977 [Microctonus aethiopoides]|nr:hypothetical protein PV326_002977 [Microctonus aethiopoides]